MTQGTTHITSKEMKMWCWGVKVKNLEYTFLVIIELTWCTLIAQDPEINSDFPKTEHKYHVEFQFLKAAPTVILCESPALSIPTISFVPDDSSSIAQEENTDNSQSSDNSGQLLCVQKLMLIRKQYPGI